MKASVKTKKDKKYKLLSIDIVHPNPWNPNVLDGDAYKKLKQGIERVLGESGHIPPIVVRPKADEAGQYEIIDGFHRWKALKELKHDKVPAVVLKGTTDKTARILTNTLNYLRGKPDRSKYAKGIVEMLEKGATFEELASLLPESTEELDQLIDETSLSIKAFEQLQTEYDQDQKDREANEADELSEDKAWVDVKFKISVAQAKVVEAEIKRVSEVLKGKNTRGRALEIMAAQSASTTLPDDLV